MKMLGFAGLERERESAGHWSVLAGPEICLTTEEKSRLADLFDRQVAACRYCIPVRYVGKVEAGEGRGRGEQTNENKRTSEMYYLLFQIVLDEIF